MVTELRNLIGLKGLQHSCHFLRQSRGKLQPLTRLRLLKRQADSMEQLTIETPDQIPERLNKMKGQRHFAVIEQIP